MNLGTSELLILAVIVVLVFGAGWLPKAARNLGRAKVEVDKAQQQFADAKKQVVETTGLDKAEQAMKKANRTLNQSPKSLLKGAAASAAKPNSDSADADVVDAEIVDREVADETVTSTASDAPDDTLNVDFTDGSST